MRKMVLLFFCFLLIMGAGACNKKAPVKPVLATRPEVVGYYVNNPGGGTGDNVISKEDGSAVHHK